MVCIVTMKSHITTPTSIKPMTTEDIFTSSAIPTNKKSKIHSTLNTIHKYFPKTILKIINIIQKLQY